MTKLLSLVFLASILGNNSGTSPVSLGTSPISDHFDFSGGTAANRIYQCTLCPGHAADLEKFINEQISNKAGAICSFLEDSSSWASGNQFQYDGNKFNDLGSINTMVEGTNPHIRDGGFNTAEFYQDLASYVKQGKGILILFDVDYKLFAHNLYNGFWELP